MGTIEGPASSAGTQAGGTLGEVRKRELDVLNALLLLFTYGQLAFILWDMLMQLHGVPELVTGLTGIADPGGIHSRGEMTTVYLTLLGAYITRNAVNKYKGREDAEKLPEYVFLGLTRGYYYLALWGTVCFVALMLLGLSLIGRLPHELMLTMSGVTAGFYGGRAVNGFLTKRAVGQLQKAASESDQTAVIMNYVAANGRITKKECQQITGLAEAQATRELSRLTQEGRLKRKGEGPGTYYQQ